MEVYVNDYKIRTVIAYVDHAVIKKETFYNGYVYEEKAVDVNQIKDIICGLKKLGKEVKTIGIECEFADFDTKYYKRFPENVIDKLYKSMDWKWAVK